MTAFGTKKKAFGQLFFVTAAGQTSFGQKWCFNVLTVLGRPHLARICILCFGHVWSNVFLHLVGCVPLFSWLLCGIFGRVQHFLGRVQIFLERVQHFFGACSTVLPLFSPGPHPSTGPLSPGSPPPGLAGYGQLWPNQTNFGQDQVWPRPTGLCTCCAPISGTFQSQPSDPNRPRPGPPKISFFFPLPPQCSIFLPSLGDLLVKIWWCF